MSVLVTVGRPLLKPLLLILSCWWPFTENFIHREKTQWSYVWLRSKKKCSISPILINFLFESLVVIYVALTSRSNGVLVDTVVTQKWGLCTPSRTAVRQHCFQTINATFDLWRAYGASMHWDATISLLTTQLMLWTLRQEHIQNGKRTWKSAKETNKRHNGEHRSFIDLWEWMRQKNQQ